MAWFPRVAILAVFGSLVACAGEEAGTRPERPEDQRGCTAGALCDRIEDAGLDGIGYLSGFSSPGHLLAIRQESSSLPGPQDLPGELWLLAGDTPELLAEDVLATSVDAVFGRAEVFFGTNPSGYWDELHGAEDFRVDLHLWRPGTAAALLAADVRASEYQLCATGDYLWVFDPESYLGAQACGTVSLVALRDASGPGDRLLLDQVCRYGMDYHVAAFAPDCRRLITVQPHLQIRPVDDPLNAVTIEEMNPNALELGPDGLHVAFPWGEGLRVVDTRTGTVAVERTLASPPTAFSPDGRYLIVERDDDPSRCGYLEVVDFQEGRSVTFDVEACAVWPYHVAFSPSGDRVAFVRRGYPRGPETELLLGNLADGTFEAVDVELWANPALGTWSETTRRHPDLVFSADGRYLSYFTSAVPADPSLGVDVHVYDTVERTGRDLRARAGIGDYFTSWPEYQTHATWSPDGRWLAYLDPSRALYLGRVEGGDVARVADGPVTDVALSNDELAWVVEGRVLRAPLAGFDP